MPARVESDFSEWIWVPPGFAHGNFFTEESMIEYFCSGEYSPGCEGGVSPLSTDLDWSLCEPGLKMEFDNLIATTLVISDKDKNALSLQAWLADERANNFLYGPL
jgi:dTDP-4-dehydrorhamnose 3,5-epimerase-like enzyme